MRNLDKSTRMKEVAEKDSLQLEVLQLDVKLSNTYQNSEVERTLGEMEVSSSMTNPKSQFDSTCKDGTVYFRWRK